MHDSWMPLSGRSGSRAALLLLAAGFLAPGPLAAQQAGAAADSLGDQVAELRARLDSLTRLVEELRAGDGGEERDAETAEDELARLREAAAEAAREGDGDGDSGQAIPPEGDGQFVGRQRSLQALNPEISINADVFAQVDADDADAENFFPREFEFSFQAALDPFSRAKIFATWHQPGGELVPFPDDGGHGHAGEGEEGGFTVEEAYMQWVNLPGGFSVKVGRVFQQFGTLNRWHNHALDFQSRPLPHTAFVGGEPLIQDGVSVHWLVPVTGFGTWETTFEVTRSRNENLFGESDGPSYLANLNGFWQLGEAWDLNLAASAITGDHAEEGVGEFRQNLFGLEGALTWRPPARSLYREFVLRGGAVLHDAESLPPPPGGADPADPDLASDRAALGLWGWGRFRFARSWYAGARVEWTESPGNPDRTAWLAGPTLTWWQSEWVRIRAEYDLLDQPVQRRSKFLIQFTFAVGPHKHETY